MSAVRKLAKALAENADTEGYGGDGVRASVWVKDHQICAWGQYASEAEADLVEKLIEWSEDG